MTDRELRLLALDGGGVRGLSALMILEQLMENVNPDAPPKPCEYFDLIGGTSTGGLIAVMLGRLKMTVGEAIAAYLSLSDRVFQKKAHRVTIKGTIQGRFDSNELTRAIKDVVEQQGLPTEELLKDGSDADCKVFVCATSKETSETVCLTSYRTSRGNSDFLNSVTIWEACRATSAASTFFDPITVGRFGEEFVDGDWCETGANNPVREVWDQAQLIWGQTLESKIKCLVSIGTGVPSLKVFKDDVLHVHETLAAIATETEQTAERFRREKVQLDTTGRYYRFNVNRGLEDIGLEGAKKVKEIAAATRRYISSQGVHQQMLACAGINLSREYFGIYRIPFSLEGVPHTRQFVSRPAEMLELENVLLPKQKFAQRQNVYVLRGLGGIGKTQLAVEFARQHHGRFSAVLWLDGRSHDSIRRSIASYAKKISEGQESENIRTYATDGGEDLDIVVRDVLSWLRRAGNTAWLLIVDNVDREYSPHGGDPDAYDVRRYLSGADHGSVLITTRLAQLEQLGESQQLGRVDKTQALAILESWYKQKHNRDESQRLLDLLDGLPLAIAQAGAYLQESGVPIRTYLRFYEQQWNELMESRDPTDVLLLDYPDRSVWTTWTISYHAISKKHKPTGNLLLLWSFLYGGDLWYGLFSAAHENAEMSMPTLYKALKTMLSEWLADIGDSEIRFCQAMRLLRSYSLAEEVEATASYAIHPVVHQWAYHYQDKLLIPKLRQLAVTVVGFAVPDKQMREYLILQRRLLPHAKILSQQAWESLVWHKDVTSTKAATILCALQGLGNLYSDQRDLDEAEKMYSGVLRAAETVLGPVHEFTLATANNLGLIYRRQLKLTQAEHLLQETLKKKEDTLGPNHLSSIRTVSTLGYLYMEQDKPAEAEKMLKRALEHDEAQDGRIDRSKLSTLHNLGVLYLRQERLDEAEQILERTLRGYEKVYGPRDIETLKTLNSFGTLYATQGKLAEAEKMYQRTLQGYQTELGVEQMQRHLPALRTVENLGDLYKRQGKSIEARDIYSKALSGFENVLGQSSPKYVRLASKMRSLTASQFESQPESQFADRSPSTQQVSQKGDEKQHPILRPRTTSDPRPMEIMPQVRNSNVQRLSPAHQQSSGSEQEQQQRGKRRKR